MLKIMLDAGHHGKRNRGVNKNYYESVQMWELHEYLKAELEEYEGVTVGVTRPSLDTSLGVVERGKKSKGYDLMLSLHTNAVSGSPATKRVVVFKPVSGKADALAPKIADTVLNTMALVKNKYWYWEVKAKKLTAKTDYYGVIRGAASVGTPCLLIEHSFHTNPEACDWLLQDSNLQRLAAQEAKTIAEHYGLIKKKSAGFKPYRVQVSISDLYIRSGPGTNYAKKGFIKPGVYTIVAEADGKGASKWGKLKSGAGWISLDFVKKV